MVPKCLAQENIGHGSGAHRFLIVLLHHGQLTALFVQIGHLARGRSQKKHASTPRPQPDDRRPRALDWEGDMVTYDC